MQSNNKNACIVVLGDFGRSPRMQYHAQSLLENNYKVDVICYTETEPIEIIKTNPNLQLHSLKPFPEIKLRTIVKYALKTIWQLFTLIVAFCRIARPQFVLVQNPPGIPTLMICYIYCRLRKSKFAVDWHNYTCSILALSSSPTNFIVKFTHTLEKYFGQLANINFCVTKAMKTDLKNNWGINAVVLYDRPPVQFQPISIQKAHDLFLKLSKTYKEFAGNESNNVDSPSIIESTVFTQKLENGLVIYKENKPGLLISSTSWTADEDFSILLEALAYYEEVAQSSSSYPNLLCVITGKGPQKSYYTELISRKKWTKISVVTPWLESEDYPTLLAAADLGVCLHWSSSGLDLPMKVVDMFGVGLTVCAKNFKCLNELVQHEENGFVFDDSIELGNLIKMWFENFPTNSTVQQHKIRIGKRLKQFQALRWRENWNLVAYPVLDS